MIEHGCGTPNLWPHCAGACSPHWHNQTHSDCSADTATFNKLSLTMKQARNRRLVLLGFFYYTLLPARTCDCVATLVLLVIIVSKRIGAYVLKYDALTYPHTIHTPLHSHPHGLSLQ